eukprot:jgi/Tetstr1/459297/TSEL_004695.t1
MPGAVVCVYGLMRRYHAVMIRWAAPTLPVFPGFGGTVLRHKGELGIVPSSSPIEYPTFRRYLARWLSPLLTPAITEAAFLTRFGTQSSRSGGASAAANADIPFATWGQHGGWKSTSAQLRYMGLDEEHVLSVSRAILTLAEEDELDDSDELRLLKDSTATNRGAVAWANLLCHRLDMQDMHYTMNLLNEVMRPLDESKETLIKWLHTKWAAVTAYDAAMAADD